MNVNEQEYFSQLLQSIPDDVKESVSISMEIASQINSVLKRKNLSQRDFAALLGKQESEISRWLSGNHTFTTKTIGKIQSILGEKIITVPIYTKQVVKFVPLYHSSQIVEAAKSAPLKQNPDYKEITQINNVLQELNNTECNEAAA